MSGLLAALNSGKSSLFTNQKLIEIAGNNISNVNTPGYSRQKGVINSQPSLEINGYFVGMGTRVDDIVREHDVFITNQLQAKNSTLGEENAKSIPLTELESIFNISEQNLATEIDRFFDAWQELASNPGGQVERDIVMQQADKLAGAFSNTSLDLDKTRNDINSTLTSKIDSINLKLTEVAELNGRISDIEATGHTANAFHDRRDLLLRELSHSLGIQSYKENNGMITVTLPGGLPLVQLTEALELQSVEVAGNIQFQLQYNNSTFNANLNNFGGEFKGLLSVRDQLIPSLKSSLDTMAYTMVSEVNTQHQAGRGLDDNTHLFFDALATETNASLNLSLAVQNTNELAAGTSSAPGDNANALLIAALRNNKMVGNTDTLAEAYGKITATVGIESRQNKLSLEGTEDALIQLENLREGVSGVSLEEEMINLIQYQAGFQASSKFLSIVDEMLDSLLSLKR